MTDAPLPPADLNLLFASNPLTLTDADFSRLTAELRRRWSAFRAEEAAKALAPKRARSTPDRPLTPEAEALLNRPIADISLEDLLNS